MKRKILAFALICAMLLTSCTGGMSEIPTPPERESSTPADGIIPSEGGTPSPEGTVDIVIPDGDMFTDRDVKTDYDSA
ncbi:MAG: hypothetical protein IJC62_00135, partial [Clostridia bacterium]|nr:hypothetical protein [Clostridia bacterium]